MSRSDPPTFDDENPEWSEEDFAKAGSAQDLPEDVLRLFPKTEKGQSRKIRVSIDLSEDVVRFFQDRSGDLGDAIDETLRKAIAR